MNKYLLTAILFFISLKSISQDIAPKKYDWHYLDAPGIGAWSVYNSPVSVRKNVVNIWVRTDYAEKIVLGVKYNDPYQEQLIEIDCYNNYFNILCTYQYDSKGKVLDYSDFRKIKKTLGAPPNTPSAAIEEYVCNKYVSKTDHADSPISTATVTDRRTQVVQAPVEDKGYHVIQAPIEDKGTQVVEAPKKATDDGATFWMTLDLLGYEYLGTSDGKNKWYLLKKADSKVDNYIKAIVLQYQPTLDYNGHTYQDVVIEEDMLLDCYNHSYKFQSFTYEYNFTKTFDVKSSPEGDFTIAKENSVIYTIIQKACK